MTDADDVLSVYQLARDNTWIPPILLTLWEFACYLSELDPNRLQIVAAPPYPGALPSEYRFLYDSAADFADVIYESEEGNVGDHNEFVDLTRSAWQPVTFPDHRERTVITRYSALMDARDAELIRPLPTRPNHYRYEVLQAYARTQGWEIPSYLDTRQRVLDPADVGYTAPLLRMLLKVYDTHFSNLTDDSPHPDLGAIEEEIQEMWNDPRWLRQFSQPIHPYTSTDARHILQVLKRESERRSGRRPD
ncbi:hypothetical protein AB4090_06020 [Acidithiobacillus sp. IBUN Pt1247-S3]|uniref:hypothetical protein n=1 Tax=Acidithiobacillus sp. IBUN Pt1247-S3 TaxID=3166642 RepID=UPI0034E47233